ncbi:MAG: divalent-cation tolerance protein CutA [Verrucomicrobiota bacterium]
MPASTDTLYLCWTTTETEAEAHSLAQLSIDQQLAACAQVDGPILSFYQWQGKAEKTTEHRIVFKVLEANLDPLERAVKKAHPYDTPQWIAVKAEKVAEKYLKWAKEASNFSAFL